MRNIRKRLIAIAVLACVVLSSAVGCSNNSVGKGNSATKTQVSGKEEPSEESSDTSNDSSITEAAAPEKIENEEGNFVATPFTVGSASDGNALGLVDANATANSSDSSDSQAATTKIETVVVTDAQGSEVTDAKGTKVTETVVVTSPATSPASDGDYKSDFEGMYAMWLDISSGENYVFNGQYIKITFKIKDGIPDKDYAVRINPDFSSNEGKSIHPDKVVQGTIRVGSGDIEPANVDGESGFILYGDNVACKQGDTIDYYINLKDNPGLVATLLWFYYDKNAMVVESVAPVGEFEEIAKHSTDIGKSN